MDPDGPEGVGPFPDSGEARSIVFPVVGAVTGGSGFNDCRDDCTRFHKGIDLVAQRLQPVVSPVDGVIARVIEGHPAAGFGVVVRDGAGYEYVFVHLNNDSPGTDDGAGSRGWTFGPDIASGAPVVAGQLLGFVGDSGVAEVSVPHVHFEIHRPDGVLLNPAWSLQSARRDWLDCAPEGEVTEEWLTVAGVRVSPDGYRPVDDTSCQPETTTTTRPPAPVGVTIQIAMWLEGEPGV